MKKVSDEDINTLLKKVIDEIEKESTEEQHQKTNYDWDKKIHVKRRSNYNGDK